MLKKSIISFAMIGAVALAVASSGGGDKKKSEAKRTHDFTPIRTTNGFTLKSGPVYSGSSIFSTNRSTHFYTQNAVVTYQQGNSTIIIPHQSRVRTTNTVTSTQPTPFKSNLNFIDLKIRLRLHK